MKTPGDRRDFLKGATAAVAAATGWVATSQAQTSTARPSSRPVRVLVWDERQPKQKEAYPHFLGNQIAGHLRKQTGMEVKSVALDDPEQGLAETTLATTDVLIWWGHVRQGEVTPETGRRIVKRIVEGSLSLVALHSAHWSTPFIEAMNERSRRDVAKAFAPVDGGTLEVREIAVPPRSQLPKREDRRTPYTDVRKFPDGSRKVDLHLPLCVFPSYRGDGKPSEVSVLLPKHPIAEGLPSRFKIAQTEMYDEPFHVPEPDEVVLEECWQPGEWFRSAMVWKVGRGRVFYFRPGHETFPVYFEENPLRVLTNAVRWLGSRPS